MISNKFFMIIIDHDDDDDDDQLLNTTITLRERNNCVWTAGLLFLSTVMNFI